MHHVLFDYDKRSTIATNKYPIILNEEEDGKRGCSATYSYILNEIQNTL